MRKIATITSKRQITIPAAIFRQAGFSDRQKLLVVENAGKVILSPANSLVDELAGSLSIPKEWRGQNLDQIVESAKEEYFKKR